MNKFRLLIVDDNKADVDFIKEVLNDTGCHYRTFECHDGEDALNFISKKKEYKDYPSVDLILLDLNLPRLHGLDILKEIDKKNIITPVIVYTSSEDIYDINKAYQYNANCYIVKQNDSKDLYNVIKILSAFWMQVAELPDRKDKK